MVSDSSDFSDFSGEDLAVWARPASTKKKPKKVRQIVRDVNLTGYPYVWSGIRGTLSRPAGRGSHAPSYAVDVVAVSKKAEQGKDAKARQCNARQCKVMQGNAM